MGPWSVRYNIPPRVYERPLSTSELEFFWDAKFRGTADSIQHAIVELPDLSSRELFNKENVERAWCALKHQYPLLGSYVEGDSRGDQMSFVIAEDRLDRCVPEEIDFQIISSLADAQRYADDAINGEPILSNSLLARIAVLFRVNEMTHVHILTHIAHCVTDGVANITVLRSFLDILSSPGIDSNWILEERLSLSLPSNDLMPPFKRNKTLYNWHTAIGRVLAAIRLSKMTGGHTLPRNYTHLTHLTPARSGRTSFSFSPEKSSQIISKCRENGLTFGNAYPVIAQVALTRLLCRRYIRGDITAAEWEYRRREPMVTGGPLSLRPFLDREWYQMGGSSNVFLAIGFFFFRLPYMPLGSASSLKPGDDLPDLLELLSYKRFLLRCGMVKHQISGLMKHPLFLHISAARFTDINKLKLIAESWRSKRGETAVQIPPSQQSFVLSHSGSSFGNVEDLLPDFYPLTRKDSSSPSLFLSKCETTLRCRPAELYLGASTRKQQLNIFIFWDMNVYGENTIREWLDEVRGAIEVFLGEENATLIPIARL